MGFSAHARFASLRDRTGVPGSASSGMSLSSMVMPMAVSPVLRSIHNGCGMSSMLCSASSVSAAHSRSARRRSSIL